MFGLIANLAGQALNLWSKKEAMEEANENYDRQIRVSKALAAEQLAITYNSISTAIMQATAAAYREEFKIKAAERGAEGQLAVQAAQLGVRGKRAELAREQATAIPTERSLTENELGRRQAVDDLIARADMEERATVNRLISNMPNVPNQDISADVLDFVDGSVGAYDQFKADTKAKTDAITLGAFDAGKQLTSGDTIKWSPRD